MLRALIIDELIKRDAHSGVCGVSVDELMDATAATREAVEAALYSLISLDLVYEVRGGTEICLNPKHFKAKTCRN